jgi:type VI secretion system protein VasD
MTRTALRGAVLALTVLALAGCAGPKKVEPPKVVATLEAAPDVNPDPSGRPSPVMIQLYELKSAGRFNGADFFSLFERASAALGQDLQQKEEVLLAPGERRTVNLQFREGSSHLGVLAGYRNFETARWRAVVDTPVDTVTRVNIRADRAAVTVRPAGN